MHLVDTNMFFAPEGGGVGRYLTVKHAWLARNTRWRHTIVAPGPETSAGAGIRIYRAPLRVRHGYSFPLTRAPWARRIVAAAPDLIESGDPYLLAWASVDAAQRLGVPAIGFYHSDVVGTSALRFGRAGEAVAIRYARALYRQFDLVLAPSRYVVGRLHELGLDRVTCQPLGVDVTPLPSAAPRPRVSRAAGPAARHPPRRVRGTLRAREEPRPAVRHDGAPGRGLSPGARGQWRCPAARPPT